MTDTTEAKAAADLASLLPTDHPLARLGRLRLDAAVRRQHQEQSMNEDVIQVGSKLRDAAVDPSAAELLSPTNAGQPGALGDPHGPHVVAIEIDDPRRHAAIRKARAAEGGAV